ncbi:MAG: hypothetical protein HYW48_06895 [Deltaproteobacteria bacterium]|nr:hypothetical protein [Deltaproteobacteria bacterium]
MNEKPRVCVIDENPLVKTGWERSLGRPVDLYFFQDHYKLFAQAEKDSRLIPSFQCIILGRMFPHVGLDIVSCDVPGRIKRLATGPLFLNWQGYVAKGDLDRAFDGKIFHRYGIKWNTLRLRIQKVDKRKHAWPESVAPLRVNIGMNVSRSQKCRELLRSMASRAEGRHKRRIEYYAKNDPQTGIKLLEAIYNKLLIEKDRPPDCPSRYINSSPIIAARILRDVLN